MIKKLKSLSLSLAALSLLVVPALVPAVANAAISTQNINSGLCSGSNGDTSGNSTTGCDATTATTAVNNILTDVINIFSLIVGIVAVIMIIIGGLKYITSGGESSNVSGAKNTIIFAIVGLVIVALAQIIVHFVLAKATSSTS